MSFRPENPTPGDEANQLTAVEKSFVSAKLEVLNGFLRRKVGKPDAAQHYQEWSAVEIKILEMLNVFANLPGVLVLQEVKHDQPDNFRPVIEVTFEKHTYQLEMPTSNENELVTQVLPVHFLTQLPLEKDEVLTGQITANSLTRQIRNNHRPHRTYFRFVYLPKRNRELGLMNE